MAASMSHLGELSSGSSPISSQDATVEPTVKTVEALKKMPPLPIVDDVHYGFPDPLQRWDFNAHDFPLIAPPACTGDLRRRPSRSDCSGALA